MDNNKTVTWGFSETVDPSEPEVVTLLLSIDLQLPEENLSVEIILEDEDFDFLQFVAEQLDKYR